MIFAAIPTFAAVLTMDIGDTKTFTTSDASTSYISMGTISRTYLWDSSNSSVVEVVSTNGASCTIRAKKAGTAIVSNKQTMYYISYDAVLGTTYRFEEGFGDSWVITVNPVDPTGVSIPGTYTLDAESSGTLNVTFSPSDAGSALTWSTSNSSVATVSNGTVYGVSPGTATITVKTANGLSDTCRVTVTKPEMTLLSVTPADSSSKLEKNTAIRFTYNFDVYESSKYSSVKLYDNTARKNVSINKSISGKTLTVTPTDALTPGHSYTATVPTSGVENVYGAKNTVDDKTTFTVAPVKIENVIPQDGSMDVDINTVVTLVFDDEIEKGSNWSDIEFADADGEPVDYNAEISENTLIIEPEEELEYYTRYMVTVPKGVVACEDVDSGDEAVISFVTIRDADKVYPPVISVNGGSAVITAEENASIYYTTDGSSPILGGILYTEPIALDSVNYCVRAIAARNGKVSAESESAGSSDKSFAVHGGSDDDFYQDVAIYKNGYVVVGYSYVDSFNNGAWLDISGKGNYDATIINYNANGNIEWKSNLGGVYGDKYYSVTATNDGFVAVGEAYFATSNKGDWEGIRGNEEVDAIIVKYDNDGNIIWKKRYDGGSPDGFYKVEVTEDGYVAVGWGNTNNKGYEDAIIVKFDVSGNVVWETSLGGSYRDEYLSVKCVEDGYVVVGDTARQGFNTGDWTNTELVGNKYGVDAVIAKYDFDGELLWKKNFGGDGSNYFNDVICTEDGYIVVGYATAASFGIGDWADVSAKGSKDAIIVKFDFDGNLEWNYNYGETDTSRRYNSMASTDRGFIVAGSSADAIVAEFDLDGRMLWEKSFGIENGFKSVDSGNGIHTAVGYCKENDFLSGDLAEMGFESFGVTDGIVVNYKVEEYECDSYIDSEIGKVAVSGKTYVTQGDRFTIPVYFSPGVDITGVNIKLVYPEGVSLYGYTSDYENVYVDTYENTITVSGDFSGSMITKGTTFVPVRLTFQTEESIDKGNYSILIDESETFMVDENYDVIAFSQAENYDFEVTGLMPKGISVIGNTVVSGVTKYNVVFFPENAESGNVEWSVSDSSVATINNDGTLTPLKNGEVMVTVTEAETGLQKSFTVISSGIKSYIDSITVDVGYFAKEYTPEETERILYVPKGTESIKLTLSYDAGSVTGDGGIFFKNVAKTVSTGALPIQITLTKKETDHDNGVYTLMVMEEITPEITPVVTVSGGEIVVKTNIAASREAVLCVAVYEGDMLKFAKKVDITGEASVTVSTNVAGDRVKVMLWDNEENMKPLCNEYEKAIK